VDRSEFSPYALASEEVAREFLLRAGASEPELVDWLPIMVNKATDAAEAFCGRRLAARTYRRTVTLSCTTTLDDETVAGSGFTLQVKALDDVAGPGIRPGTRVASLTSASSLELSKKATAAGTADLVFGSTPLLERGDGSASIHLHESPIASLADIYSVKRHDLAGVLTAIDLADAEIYGDGAPGLARLEIASGVFGDGSRYEIECKAGYDVTTWSGRQQLEWAVLRMVQILWQDLMKSPGRTGDINLIQATQRFASFRIPDDIRADLVSYRRIG